VPTPGVREVVAARAIDADVLSLDAHDLAGILGTIEAVGRSAGDPDAASALVADLGARAERIRDTIAGRPRPRVLAIEWLDPPFAPGHWAPEMVDLAGGINLVGDAGARSREHAWEDLRGLDPDVLLIMPCGYGLDASRADADRYADALATVAPRALAQERAFVVDGSSYFNRSGPRTWDGIEILAALLHPDVLPPPPAAAAARWEPTPAERSQS
jgi:iron complex transport system substrate-binding protein